MKLFEEFEAVWFPEEELMLVTKRGYLYYIYDSGSKKWRKYYRAGNVRISLDRYRDVSREEMTRAMGGIFPVRETDFMRLCGYRTLNIRDIFCLFEEDYPAYMSDRMVYRALQRLLTEPDTTVKECEMVRDLLEKACEADADNDLLLEQIKELSRDITGRDIYSDEIEIVDGYDSSSFVWIRPAKVTDYTDSNGRNNVSVMSSARISIDERDVGKYLSPFLYKYFDNDLLANRMRREYHWTDDDGTEHSTYLTGFQWYLTHNFYSYESMKDIINDMRDTMEALRSGRENKYTEELLEGCAPEEGSAEEEQDEDEEYAAFTPRNRRTETGRIISFFERLIYRLEYMMRVGKEKGFDLISFMGP